jgi:hypothetical protein
MPSTSSRARVAARRSPRPAPPVRPTTPPPSGRPLEAPFAAAFGVLVAAEHLYLGWLLLDPEALGWYAAVPAVLAVLAAAGAVLVLLGRGRGWVPLTVASALLLLGLLGLVVLFGALGGGAALWQALLLLLGPIGCLALTLRRPVRAWTSPRTTRGRRRSAGGRRSGARSR